MIFVPRGAPFNQSVQHSKSSGNRIERAIRRYPECSAKVVSQGSSEVSGKNPSVRRKPGVRGASNRRIVMPLDRGIRIAPIIDGYQVQRLKMRSELFRMADPPAPLSLAGIELPIVRLQ